MMNKNKLKSIFFKIDIDNRILNKINNMENSGLENYNDGLDNSETKWLNYKTIVITFSIIILAFIMYIFVNRTIHTRMTFSKISIAVDENKVYFENFNDNGSLYVVDYNGTNINKIINDFSMSICIHNSYIYYISDDLHIYRINKDGSNKKEITKIESFDIEIIGEWLYFTSSNTIYRINKSGNQSTLEKVYSNKLIIEEDVNKNIFSYKNNLIVTQSNGLVIINLDNKHSEILVKNNNSDTKDIHINKVINYEIYYSIGKNLFKFNFDNKSINEIFVDKYTGINYITNDDIYMLSFANNGNYILNKIDLKTDSIEKFKLNSGFENFVIFKNNLFGYNPANKGTITLIDLYTQTYKIIN